MSNAEAANPDAVNAAPQQLRIDALVRPQTALLQADRWLATDDPAQRRERLRWIASAAHRTGDGLALRGYIEQLEGLAESRGDALAAMHADFLRAESDLLNAQREDGLAATLRAAGRVQDDRSTSTRYEVELQLCDDYVTAGEPSNASPHCAELLLLADRREDALDRGQAYNIAGLAQLESGNAAAATALFERARAAVKNLGGGEVARMFGDNLAEALLRQGRADEALQLARAALADELRNDRRGHALLSQANIARALHQLGRSDEALREIDAALRDTRDLVLPLDLLELLATQAEIAHATARHELAFSTQARMLELLQRPRDSQRERLLADREAGFAKREAQLQLQALEQQAQRRNLELDAERLRADRQQQRLRIVAAFAFALSLVAAMLVLRVRAQRRHALRLAQQQVLTEQALETVSRQRERIETLAAARTSFFANVSHELRTPLTLISAPLQDALRGTALTPATIAAMQRSASRLERLVTQLLDLERLDAGQFPLHPKHGDLRDWIDETVAAFASTATRERIGLHWQRPGAVLPVEADAEQIARVLSNLLSNALKFTPPGGQVRIGTVDAGGSIEVRVEDSGPGIPAEWRERVFDRFAQIGGEATRRREGAGLGLALCLEIARRHGGNLEATTSELGGATLLLRLPTASDYPETATLATHAPDLPIASSSSTLASLPLPSAPTWGDDRHRRVLVAEDNDELRAYVVGLLAREFEVIDAADGESALALAREQLPDLIISDVSMPRRDGFSFASALRANALTAGIPLIFLTARAGQEDEIEGLARGADRYLRKPFDAELLRAHVHSALHAVERLRRTFVARAANLEQTSAVQPSSDDASIAASMPAATHASDSPRPDRVQPRVEPTARLRRENAELDRRVRAWFEARLHDETLEIDDLASALSISRPTLNRRVQSAAGLAPAALLREMRMLRARTLLEACEGTVSEIAYAVGYGSLSSFGRAYREYFGHAPTLTADP